MTGKLETDLAKSQMFFSNSAFLHATNTGVPLNIRITNLVIALIIMSCAVAETEGEY